MECAYANMFIVDEFSSYWTHYLLCQSAAIAGLAVTYGLNLTTLQAFVIWLLGILESDIISVERILQYTCIPSEAPLVIDAHRPNSNWPSHGEVAIRHLQVRN